MSKTFTPLRFRLTAALALVLCACAVVAAPASAAPPIGTVYCMDGTLSFVTWDVASQHVTDKTVTVYGGVITIGEADPANNVRDALRQYYDALETSDATGNYGVDTTIPNYVIHHISAGRCPSPDNHVFLCYSKFNDVPGVWPAAEAQALMDDGYWSPEAVEGTLDGGTNIGGYHLVCNPPVAPISFASLATDPTTSYIGGDGTPVGEAAAGIPGYYPLPPPSR
jgi:hypothetical protein